MRVKIKTNYLLEDSLSELGSEVQVGNKYYRFLPFWFEFNEDGVFIHNFENLPVELKRYIASERDRIIPKDLGTILDYPIVDSDNSNNL